jgi:hypothetical protein
MFKEKGGRRRTGYAYNGSASTKTLSVVKVPQPERPVEQVKDAGSVKAQLVGKLGSRGYGRLLAELRDQAA